MIYDISHRTDYTYAQAVSISHHLLHLTPRRSPGQSCRRHSLVIEPPSKVMREAGDYFGNPTAYVTIEQPHAKLSVVALSTIEVEPVSRPEPHTTAPWDSVSPLLQNARRRDLLDALQYTFDSPFTRAETAEEYARASFPAGRPVLEGALDLMHRIYAEFAYEGGVTDLSTPVDVVLAERRGVCQDFAHLQIACLRAMGLPARYVSGYLLTHPPEGRPRLVGADASHAWLAVWVPDHGWVDLDPTNDVIPSSEHITVAWGRDYGDVSPITGLVVGGGEHEVEVAVDVLPVEG